MKPTLTMLLASLTPLLPAHAAEAPHTAASEHEMAVLPSSGGRAFSLGFNVAGGPVLRPTTPAGVDLTGTVLGVEARFFLPNDRLSFDVQLDPLGMVYRGTQGDAWVGARAWVHPRIAQHARYAFTVAPGLGVHGGTQAGLGAVRADFDLRVGADLSGPSRRFESGLYLRATNGVLYTQRDASWISEIGLELTLSWNRFRRAR